MTGLGRAPADQILSANLGQRCQQVGLQQQPSAIHRDHLGSLFLGGVTTNREGVPPPALAPTGARRPADVDFVRPDLVRLATVCVHHNWHGFVSNQSGGARNFGARRTSIFLAALSEIVAPSSSLLPGARPIRPAYRALPGAGHGFGTAAA